MSDNLRFKSYMGRLRGCKSEAELDWIGRAVKGFVERGLITDDQKRRLIEHGKSRRKQLARG